MKHADKIFQAENEQNPPHDHWLDSRGEHICPWCFEEFDLPVEPVLTNHESKSQKS
jgi:hypothetical protein